MFSHANLVPYPTDLGAAPDVLISKLRGAEVEISCLVHAGYHVAGFGLGALLPDNHPPAIGQQPVQMMTCEELASALASAKEPSKKAAVPWLLIVSTVLSLLQQWLKKG